MKPKIVLAVLSISLFSLFTLEVSIRILSMYSYAIKKLCFYRYDSSLPDNIVTLESLLLNAPFPMEPGANEDDFILNSRGLRTPEYEVTKSRDTTRIVAIGDSFTFSSGHVPYPQHFTVVLEGKLEKWLGKSVELINLGYPSVGPRFEQKMLELEGARLNPDLFIWAFFVGNDFVDDIPVSASEASIEQRVLMNCYFCRLIRNAYILLSYMKNLEALDTAKQEDGPTGTYVGSPDDYDPNKPTLTKSKFLEIQRGRMGIYANKSFPWHYWKNIQQTMIEVRDLCRDLGIPILLVIIPDQNQVDDELLGKVAKGLGKNVGDFEMDFPQRLLTEFFRRNEIRYCDLLPAFRTMRAEAILFHRQDTHWNREGNVLAAQTIFDCLIQREDDIARSKLVTYTFSHHMQSADIITEHPHYVPKNETPLVINNQQRMVFFEHPNSEVVFNDVPVIHDAQLEFGAGISQAAWDKSGDGVLFEIVIVDEQSRNNIVFSQWIDPKNNVQDRKWFDNSLELTSFSGQKVSFIFKTSSGPNGNRDYDWAGWSNPQIVQRSN